MLNETFWEFSNTVYCCTSEHKVLPINIAACFVAFGFRNDYNSVRIAFQNLDLHHVRLAFFMQHHSTFEVPEENPFITFGSDKITAIRIYSHVSDVAQKKKADCRQKLGSAVLRQNVPTLSVLPILNHTVTNLHILSKKLTVRNTCKNVIFQIQFDFDRRFRIQQGN